MRQRSTQAILRVAPGVPNGTPAVMTTRWPGSAIPRGVRSAPLCTMSPKLLTSLVWTQRAPENGKATCGIEVRGQHEDRAAGSRAPRRPDVVWDTIAAAPTRLATWRAAALISSGEVCSCSIRVPSKIE